MKFLCKCLGGSHLYGLNTPESDLDYRGIFINQDINTIIGLDRYEHQDIKTETQDEFYWEIRHYLNSLRKSNTQSLELLFNNNWIECDILFKRMQFDHKRLIDSEHLYNSLTGYLGNEYRLAIGERKGDIGSTRREQIEKYGFSPKNWSNLFRLCQCGIYFYTTGLFPSNFSRYLPEWVDYLREIRQTPEKFTIPELTQEYNIHRQLLDEVYATTNIHYQFDKKYANYILLELYGPIIEREREI